MSWSLTAGGENVEISPRLGTRAGNLFMERDWGKLMSAGVLKHCVTLLVTYLIFTVSGTGARIGQRGC